MRTQAATAADVDGEATTDDRDDQAGVAAAPGAAAAGGGMAAAVLTSEVMLKSACAPISPPASALHCPPPTPPGARLECGRAAAELDPCCIALLWLPTHTAAPHFRCTDEIAREERIRANEAQLVKLGLMKAKDSLAAAGGAAAAAAAAKPAAKKRPAAGLATADTLPLCGTPSLSRH